MLQRSVLLAHVRLSLFSFIHLLCTLDSLHFIAQKCDKILLFFIILSIIYVHEQLDIYDRWCHYVFFCFSLKQHQHVIVRHTAMAQVRQVYHVKSLQQSQNNCFKYKCRVFGRNFKCYIYTSSSILDFYYYTNISLIGVMDNKESQVSTMSSVEFRCLNLN